MSLRVALPLAVMLALSAAVHAGPSRSNLDTTIKLPDNVKWQREPGGANRFAVLVGDPNKPGFFIQLLDIAANTISRPHFHMHDRTYTVIKGHWDVGTGPKYDTAAMKAWPAGSVVSLRARGIIYDGCKQAPCIIEIVGAGQDPNHWVDKNGKSLPMR